MVRDLELVKAAPHNTLEVVEGVGREENGGLKSKRNVELRTGVGDTMGEGQVPGDGALSLKLISNIEMKDKSLVLKTWATTRTLLMESGTSLTSLKASRRQDYWI